MVRVVGNALLTVWIFGGAVIYYYRYSWFFYREHEQAIAQLIDQIREFVG